MGRRRMAEDGQFRQPLVEGPADFLAVLHEDMVQHGKAEEGPQKYLGADDSGHRCGVQDRYQRVEQEAEDGVKDGDKVKSLYGKESAAQPNGNGGTVEPLPARAY